MYTNDINWTNKNVWSYMQTVLIEDSFQFMQTVLIEDSFQFLHTICFARADYTCTHTLTQRWNSYKQLK